MIVFFSFIIFICVVQIVKNMFLSGVFCTICLPHHMTNSCSGLNWTFSVSFQTVVPVLVSQTVFLTTVLVLGRFDGRIALRPHFVSRTTTDRSRKSSKISYVFLLPSHTVRKIALWLPVQQRDSRWKILIFYSDDKIQ